MQLGKSLIGAIIGAALGVGLLMVVYLLFHVDHAALAIAVAILTGLGVRTLVSTSGHASYARGALTGILALAAYVGGWLLVAEVAKARAAAAPKSPLRAAAKQADRSDNDNAPASGGVAMPAQLERNDRTAATGTAMPRSATPGQNPLDYVWLAIAALVAYELGRGTGTKPVAVAESEPADEGSAPEDRPANS